MVHDILPCMATALEGGTKGPVKQNLDMVSHQWHHSSGFLTEDPYGAQMCISQCANIMSYHLIL